MAQGLERLEQQLERWVEGTLAGWLGAEIPAAILAGQLARAMEDGVQTDMRGGLRAPDHYALALHPDHVQALLERGAEWTGEMGRELLAAAQAHGFGMARDPQVSLAADPGLTGWQIRVLAWHTDTPLDFTQTMERPAASAAERVPPGAFLIVNGDRHVNLDRPLFNIGRRVDNQIVLGESSVSRTHAQLRARDGRFVVFDLGSSTGTLVNGRPIRQHILRPGDVLTIGASRLVYGEDPKSGSESTLAFTPPLPKRGEDPGGASER